MDTNTTSNTNSGAMEIVNTTAPEGSTYTNTTSNSNSGAMEIVNTSTPDDDASYTTTIGGGVGEDSSCSTGNSFGNFLPNEIEYSHELTLSQYFQQFK